MIEAQPLVIRTAGDGYEHCARCILESLAAQLVSGGRRRLLLSDIDKHVVTEWEWLLLDDFMRDDALLSDAEITFMQDLRPLRRTSESLRKMADVNLVHHYARLAQMVTDTTGDRSSAPNTPTEKPGLVGRRVESAGLELLLALLLSHSTVLPGCTVRSDEPEAVDTVYV